MSSSAYRLSLNLSLILLTACTAPPAVPITEQELTHTYTVATDVVYASPDSLDLTLDMYTPDTEAESYPVLIIVHGGGWLINDKSPMTAMSQYIASHANYVVCNINYRLLVDQGNTVTMDEMIQDVMGATLWIKEHIAEYGGDPAQLIITGDSAGGHLAAMVVMAGNRLSSDGFSGTPLAFNPSYLPDGKTAEAVASEGRLDLQGAIFSYGAFDMITTVSMGGLESPSNMFWSFAQAEARGIFGDSISIETHPEMYTAISPQHIIPNASQRSLPPML